MIDIIIFFDLIGLFSGLLFGIIIVVLLGNEK